MKAGDILLINCKRCIALRIFEDSVLGLEIRTGKQVIGEKIGVRFLKELAIVEYVQAYENAAEEYRRILETFGFNHKPQKRDVRSIFINRH